VLGRQIWWNSTYSANSLKTNIIPKCKKIWQSSKYYIVVWHALGVDPWVTGTAHAWPYQLCHQCNMFGYAIPSFVDCLYMSLWLIFPRCKWMRLNQHDQIRLCSQKFATWKSLRLRSKNAPWCRIAKFHVWKLVITRPRLAFSDSIDESFLRISRVTAESAEALRDGANVVRTETGNCFCVRICSKFSAKYQTVEKTKI